MVKSRSAGRSMVVRGGELDDLCTALEPEGQTRLVLGDAGMGKTTLLAALAAHAMADAWVVLRATGSESESALDYATLHQLLRPLMGGVDALAVRQRAALLDALGMSDELTAPNELLVRIAALTLFSNAAAAQPLLLVVDDVHWADQASLDVLEFVGRRLEGERISIVLAARPDLGRTRLESVFRPVVLRSLSPHEADRLLDAQPHPPAGPARMMVLEQSSGLPLALVELARVAAENPDLAVSWTETPLPLNQRLEQLYADQLRRLPDDVRSALLLTSLATDTDVDSAGSAGSFEPAPGAMAAAEDAGLITRRDGRIAFTHPLVRSAVYHEATPAQRIRAHEVLAAAVASHPDRQAWHLAAATEHPDEAIAARLEQIGRAAKRRGSMAVAAAALERAAELSSDSSSAAARITEAARAAGAAGFVSWTQRLSAGAVALSDDPATAVEMRRMAGWVLSTTDQHAACVTLLLELATEQASLSPAVAWGCLPMAATAAYYSGDPALRERVLSVYASIPPPAQVPADPSAVGDPVVTAIDVWTHAMLEPFRRDETTVERLRTLSRLDLGLDLRPVVASANRQLDETHLAIEVIQGVARQVDENVRGPAIAHGTMMTVLSWAYGDAGRWDEALDVVSAARHIAATYDQPVVLASGHALEARIAACRNDPEGARRHAAEVTAAVDPVVSRIFAVLAHHAAGLAASGQGDHRTAFAELRRLVAPDGSATHYRDSYYALADLAEAAVRSGQPEEGRFLVDGLLERFTGTASQRLKNIVDHARALLDTDGSAEDHYRAAVGNPEGDAWPYERARAQLSYGRWLRRERRSVEARPVLELAAQTFARLAATTWLELTRNELRAAGVEQAPFSAEHLASLTPSERQVVLLAGRGFSNRTIADRLFLSPRTVESHLYKAFPKLGISTRAQLHALLSRLD